MPTIFRLTILEHLFWTTRSNKWRELVLLTYISMEACQHSYFFQLTPHLSAIYWPLLEGQLLFAALNNIFLCQVFSRIGVQLKLCVLYTMLVIWKKNLIFWWFDFEFDNSHSCVLPYLLIFNVKSSQLATVLFSFLVQPFSEVFCNFLHFSCSRIILEKSKHWN